ncbi:MAG: hypothetical protein Q4E47_00785 [Candidatus Saccharibacteria bacterium]|nr:hypothetical protein [Candidatus Saccharibacteria bacterium]
MSKKQNKIKKSISRDEFHKIIENEMDSVIYVHGDQSRSDGYSFCTGGEIYKYEGDQLIHMVYHNWPWPDEDDTDGYLWGLARGEGNPKFKDNFIEVSDNITYPGFLNRAVKFTKLTDIGLGYVFNGHKGVIGNAINRTDEGVEILADVYISSDGIDHLLQMYADGKFCGDLVSSPRQYPFEISREEITELFEKNLENVVMVDETPSFDDWSIAGINFNLYLYNNGKIEHYYHAEDCKRETREDKVIIPPAIFGVLIEKPKYAKLLKSYGHGYAINKELKCKLTSKSKLTLEFKKFKHSVDFDKTPFPQDAAGKIAYRLKSHFPYNDDSERFDDIERGYIEVYSQDYNELIRNRVNNSKIFSRYYRLAEQQIDGKTQLADNELFDVINDIWCSLDDEEGLERELCRHIYDWFWKYIKTNKRVQNIDREDENLNIAIDWIYSLQEGVLKEKNPELIDILDSYTAKIEEFFNTTKITGLKKLDKAFVSFWEDELPYAFQLKAVVRFLDNLPNDTDFTKYPPTLLKYGTYCLGNKNRREILKVCMTDPRFKEAKDWIFTECFERGWRFGHEAEALNMILMHFDFDNVDAERAADMITNLAETCTCPEEIPVMVKIVDRFPLKEDGKQGLKDRVQKYAQASVNNYLARRAELRKNLPKMLK